MKNRIIFAFLSFTVHSFAQQTGIFDFQLINTESGISDTMNIHISQTSKKFAANFSGHGLTERFVLDSIAGKVVELIDNGESQFVFVTPIPYQPKYDIFGYGHTNVSELIMNEISDDEMYVLLDDEKTIHGWDCRKVNLLREGKVIGSGWVAMGLYIGFTTDFGFFGLYEGTIIELTVKENGVVVSEMKLMNSTKTIANQTKEFSLEIPEGYELYEDDLDYDDEE